MLRSLATVTACAVFAAWLSGCKPAESRGAERTESPTQTPPARVTITRSSGSQTPRTPAETPKSISKTPETRQSQPVVQRATSTVDPRSVMAVLRKARISTVDRTKSISPSIKDALISSIEQVGGDSVVLFGTPDGFEFLAIGFSNQQALESFLKAPPSVLVWNNIVLSPSGGLSSTWEAIERAVVKDGGKRVDSQANECQSTLGLLHSLRSAVSQYEKQNGHLPDFSGLAWKELQAAQLITSLPRNALSTRDVADRIEIVSAVGVKGDAVSEKKAGWVWNSSNNALYAAGFTDAALTKLSQGASGGRHFIAMPDVLVEARLQLLREAIARLQTEGNRPGKTVHPTIVELSAHFNEHGSCPVNPMNNSAAIQPMEWIKRKPQIHGSAGWNYDQKAGKIWANSNVLGENEF